MSKSWNKKKNKKLESLIKEIRRLPKYKNWRQKVLYREYGLDLDKYKKKIIHHNYEITKIILDNHITNVKQALRCKELWNISNGVVLKSGEHFILTRLRRYKYLTRGFYNFIINWLKTCKVEQKNCGA